jgi:polyhydroxyalkanoate synthase
VTPVPPDGEALARRFSQAREAVAAYAQDAPRIGQTSKTRIAATDKTSLYRYDRDTPARLPPVLIVYGLVGRQTIADLEPEHSLVRDLLARGADVYMVDWGYPDRSDRFLLMDDYVDGYLDGFVGEICAHLGVPSITLVGICEGGLLSTFYAALHAERVRNLILTVTPIDFHADCGGNEGFLNLWLRALEVDDIERLIDAFGNLPGGVMGAAFEMMSPRRSLTKYNLDLMEIAESPEELLRFLRMETWLADRPDHPGAAAKQFLIGLYKLNTLVAGTFEISGRAVDLGALHMPVLNVYARKDHIVPPACAKALGAHVGSEDYTELGLDHGHIGAFVSDKSRLGAEIAGWLEAR